jgi:hypothetical protein
MILEVAYYNIRVYSNTAVAYKNILTQLEVKDKKVEVSTLCSQQIIINTSFGT